MELNDEFTIPNAFGLRAADFDFDMPGYRTALAFLSDLAGGTEHNRALEVNGGDKAQIVAWSRSDRFRRVYAKCRAAGEAEREAARARERAAAATEEASVDDASGQKFVALEDVPAQRSVFSLQPNRASWGE